MKKLFTILLALVFISSAATAQIQLIGLNYDAGLGRIDVTRWDALTGTVLNSVPTTANGVVAGSSVHDSYSGHYYFRSPSNLVSVGFAPDTVENLSLVELATSAEIDMANGKIFSPQPTAIVDSNGAVIGSTLAFLEYDILNGVETVVGNIAGNQGILLDASAYDSNTGTYFFLGIDSVLGLCLYAVPTRDTVFSSTKVFVNAGTTSLLDLEYDNQTDVLYALLFEDVNLPQRNLQIHALDRLTGNLTLDGDFPGLESYVSGSSCYDNASGSFVFQAGDSMGSFAVRIYNTLANTLVSGNLPFGNLMEFQCDNTAFAFAKYGAVAAAEPATAAFTMHPNPVHDRLQIEFASRPMSLDIMDMHGRVVARHNAASATMVVDVSGYAPGIYWLRSMDQAGQVQSRKFVVR